MTVSSIMIRAVARFLVEGEDNVSPSSWYRVKWSAKNCPPSPPLATAVNIVSDNDNEGNKNPTNLPNWKEEKKTIMFSVSWGAQRMTNIAENYVLMRFQKTWQLLCLFILQPFLAIFCQRYFTFKKKLDVDSRSSWQLFEGLKSV